LFIDAVVSRIIATLNGPTVPPFALATAVAEIDHDGAPNRLVKNTGTFACCVTSRKFASAGGVPLHELVLWFEVHGMPQPYRRSN
jgi:hypothetical protein